VASKPKAKFKKNLPATHRGGAALPTHAAPNPDTFKLISESSKQVADVANIARDAIKAHYTDPVQLATFIESHQTPVFVLEHWLLGGGPLAALGYEPGFITPGQGRRFQMLQKLLQAQGKRLGQHAASDDALSNGLPHGVIVLTRPLFTVGYLSHQLHHWLAFRAGMPGYSDRAQQLYRQFWQKQNGSLGQEVYKMSAEDLMALKAAINRDMEALQFLKTITNEVIIPAQQARRVSDQLAGGGSASA
jgi:hypothetical protein